MHDNRIYTVIYMCVACVFRHACTYPVLTAQFMATSQAKNVFFVLRACLEIPVLLKSIPFFVIALLPKYGENYHCQLYFLLCISALFLELIFSNQNLGMKLVSNSKICLKFIINSKILILNRLSSPKSAYK